MKLRLLPLLERQRDLHRLPRGPERFKAYIQTITGGQDEIHIPLVGMNPMGKEHVAALIDALLGWGAEAFTDSVLQDIASDLHFLEGELQLGLVLTDDLKGGWTNSVLSDYAQRFENQYDVKHGWALVPVWTTKTWTKDTLRIAILTTLYRTLYKLRHGLPQTLGAMLEQEGLASVFAGQVLTLEPELFGYTQELIRPYFETSQKAICVACLYGDEAASSVGYSGLGLPENAGFVLAYERAKGQKALAFL